jgi:copper chaperone
MTELTFEVPGVSCQHCVNSITQETKSAGVSDVEVDLNSKRVYVAFDPAKVSEQQVKEAIEEAGYDIEGQQVGKALSIANQANSRLKFL